MVMIVGIAVSEAGWRRRVVFSLYSRRTPLQLVAHSIQRSVLVLYFHGFKWYSGIQQITSLQNCGFGGI